MANSYFKNHPVQSGIVVGVVLLFISSTGLTAWFQNIAWWAAVINVLDRIWKAIIWFLTISIPFWWILIFVAGSILIRYVIKIYKIRLTPDWHNYTTDRFGKFQYVWKYGKQSEIQCLMVLCSECNTPLISGFNEEIFKCPRCIKYFDSFRNRPIPLNEVKVLILDNISRNNYKI